MNNQVSITLSLFVLSAIAAIAISPTAGNVEYGEDPRQFIDFYQAESDTPTPVIVYIHGGAWTGGSAGGITRTNVFGDDNKQGEGIQKILRQGISVASVEYRFLTQARREGVTPPVQWPLEDAARSIQFIRSQATEWNLDPTRLGGTGSSAGGCSVLWLAMHADMADPSSRDPVARQSTRLSCAGVLNAQSSLDLKQLHDWFETPRYGAHAFGFLKKEGNREISDMDAALEAREEILLWIRAFSPIEHATADDPPMFLAYLNPPQPAGDPQRDSVHGAAHGIQLKAKLDTLGVEFYIAYPGSENPTFTDHIAFLIDKLQE